MICMDYRPHNFRYGPKLWLPMHTFSGSLEECAQKPQMGVTWTLETLEKWERGKEQSWV